MKTTACLLVIVAALSGFVHAQPGDEPLDPKRKDPTIGPIVPHETWSERNARIEFLLEEGKKKYTAKSSSTVPAEALDLARQAREKFENGDYQDAENLYIRALTKAPNNVYLLSNKAVCQLRKQDYAASENTFRRALAIDPTDDFSHCTLGIAQYQQGKFDDAIQALALAIVFNPKNATAHNYFGICASQKGWQDAAKRELEMAVALAPDYADAHFNLAIVLATQSPPDKEGAREHYQSALKLGAEPDRSLELMIK